MTGSDPAAIFEQAASARPGVARRDADGAITYEAGGRAFAALSGGSAEFRLRPEMVRAALRTPGTRASERGPEWVAFEPPAELERYDMDRLHSWFAMAARLAEG